MSEGILSCYYIIPLSTLPLALDLLELVNAVALLPEPCANDFYSSKVIYG